MSEKKRPKFEVVTTTAGAVSIRNNIVNETMHNPVGPWVEANALYIDQSKLRESLLKNSTEEFVIFDVGLGAAANALAALACIESTGEKSRPVRIVSFEKDLELLEFALENSSQFAHFAGYESRLKSLMKTGFWGNEKIKWHLRKGEFPKTIEQEEFHADLIFYDPYSPKVNNEMWTTDCFQKLRAKSKEPCQGGTLLLTYSQATRIRAAFIQAGFFVGYGSATGLKDETTQAATRRELLESPVGQEWIDRWTRSHVRYPFGCEPDQYPAVDHAIELYRAAFRD